MKNFLSLALSGLLLGSAVSARAAAAPAERRYLWADKALDSVALNITQIKKCLSYWDSLKSDLAAKKQEVSANNGGSIPAAYQDFFAVKNARVSKVYGACLALDKELAAQFDQARNQIRMIEPGSAPGIPQRRERLTSLQTSSNSLFKRFH